MLVSPAAGENALPQVAGLEAVRVGRVAGAVVPALVEGQEPRTLALEMRAEPHLVVVHREVGYAASELEELLAGVRGRACTAPRRPRPSAGEAVLQLEGRHRQAVDEQAEVERPQGLVAAVAKLARDGEAVPRVAFSGGGVAGRRRAGKARRDAARP